MSYLISKSEWRRWAGRILVNCPKCGKAMALDHTIDSEGMINPSLDCPLCPFHDWASLEGWEEENADT